MGKNRKILLLIASVVLSLFFDINLSTSFYSTIYTVTGIIFSVGLGLIVTFNVSHIKSKTALKYIRENLKTVRNNFILFFMLSTFATILNNYITKTNSKEISLNIMQYDIFIYPNTSLLIIMVFSIIYFIANFVSIQRLNDDITDEINNK